MSKYAVELGGAGGAVGPTADVDTITEGRKWAESHGDQADWAKVYDRTGTVVALHGRDRNAPFLWWSLPIRSYEAWCKFYGTRHS